MTAAGALFAAGQFDQYKRNAPHAVLAEALEQRVRRVLQEHDLVLERYREGLREAVGAHGALMVNLVPELALLIGAQPVLPLISGEDAKSRLRGAIERMLRVFASDEHPLVRPRRLPGRVPNSRA